MMIPKPIKAKNRSGTLVSRSKYDDSTSSQRRINQVEKKKKKKMKQPR